MDELTWAGLAVWALEHTWQALAAGVLAGAGLSTTGLLLLGAVDRWLLPADSDLPTWLTDNHRG